MQEKIMRTDKVKVSMQIVDDLYELRKKRNVQLKGTKQFCNLFPNMDKAVCKECSGNELCVKHKREREYIHEQEDPKDSSRRKRKQDNPKRMMQVMSEDASENSGYDCDCDCDYGRDELDAKYPCGEMYFACPNNAICEYGKKCIT